MDRELPAEFTYPNVSLPYVGRDREKKSLQAALDLMLRGYGSVVLISGESGIGKTTLIDQFRSEPSIGETLMLTGHCYDLVDTLPYAPWRRVFLSAPDESGLPDLGKRLSTPDWQSPAGNQHELFEMISDSLGVLAARTPLVLVIEDIHWADYASLELLRYVSHHADETLLLIIATYRTDSFEQPQRIAEIIPRLVRESNTRRIDLRRLGPDDTEALVTARYELPDVDNGRLTEYLFSRAEGNPFFTVELMRDLEDRGTLVQGEQGWQLQELAHVPVPEVIRQVIATRLEYLDQESLEFLEMASVFGSSVPLDLWQAASDASIEKLVDTIQRAEKLHLASESPDGLQLRFNHALTRDTIYHRKPALHRRQQHRLVAELLVQQPWPSPDYIAHHFVQAGDPRAVEWLIHAGEQTERLHAAHDAINSISRAVDLASSHCLDLPACAYRIRARALDTIGSTDSAHRDLESALLAARDANDLFGEWEALSEMGMLWSRKDYNQAKVYYENALDVARAMGDQRALAQSLNRIGNWRANTGDLDSAIELHQQALDINERLGDRLGLLETHDLLGTTSFLAGDYCEALDHLEIAISEARRLDDKLRLASALTMVPTLGGNLDINFDATVAASRVSTYWLDCAEEGLAISRNIGWKAGESFALTTLGVITAARGNLGRGLKLVEQGYSIARSIAHQQWLVFASLVLGLVWLELEDYKRAEFYLARCRAGSDAVGSHLWRTLAHAYLGLTYLNMGDVSRASAILSPYLASESTGRSNSQRAFQIVLARVRLAEDDANSALEHAERLLAQEDTPMLQGVPQVLKVKADALAALGNVQDAIQTYRDADNAATLLGLDPIRWRIKAAHSTLLMEHGNDETAAVVANDATEMVHVIGQTISDISVRERFVQRAAHQIPSIGDSRAEPGALRGLSSRELEVLQQTAHGFTNAEIGRRLFISPRTVAQHLQSIYRKLGVESRTAAAAFAHDHDLT